MPNPTVKYSNGVDLIRVESALVGLVGWQQPTASSFTTTLSVANKTSRSGRYFNDGSFHAVVTPQAIKSTQEDADISDNNLNTLLLNRQKAAIQRALTGVFNSPEFIEQVQVYSRYGNNDTTIDGAGQFVGYEIMIAKKPDVTVQLNTAILMFDQDVTFTLYLFKDGKKSHVWSQEVSAVAYEATPVSLTDLYLNYSNDKSAKFYIGYFQDDLGAAKAIQEQVTFNQSRIFGAEPFACAVSGAFLDTLTRSYNTQPYGFNLEATSFRDHTQGIVQKSYLFSELIGLTMAYMTIEELVYSLRINKEARAQQENLIKAGIQLDLSGTVPLENAPQVQGLRQRIDRELARVKEQFYPKPKAQVVSLCH